MKLTKTFVAGLLSIFFAVTLTFYFLQFDLLSHVLYLVSPLISVIAGIYAIRTFKLSNNTGMIFGLLTAGLACFFIGDALFFYYQFIAHTDPFPSLADVFYIVAYPILFIGFLKAAVNHRIKWQSFSKFYLAMILLLVTALSALVAYFGVYQAYSPTDSGLANLISIAYGVGDLIIIIPSLFVLKIILDFRGGKLFYSWALMLIALMSMLAADLLYAVYRNSYDGLVWPYKLLDLPFMAMYLLFAFSFFYTASTIKELRLRLKK